jgi:hypothetical protein
VLSALRERFKTAEIKHEDPIFHVHVDGNLVVSVNWRTREFQLAGRVWPVHADYAGRGWHEALVESAYAAALATERAQYGGYGGSGNTATQATAATPRIRAVDKVRKMLALAKGRENTPEGETAAKLALKVMAENALADEDIAVPPEVEERSYECVADWDRALWLACTKHVGAVLLHDQVTNDLVTFGPDETLELAEYLHDTIARGLQKEQPDNGTPYARGFLATAVAAVAKRLEAMHKAAAKEDVRGTALVRLATANTAAWAAAHLDIEPEAPINEHQLRREAAGLYVPEGAAAGRRVPIVTAIVNKGGS